MIDAAENEIIFLANPNRVTDEEVRQAATLFQGLIEEIIAKYSLYTDIEQSKEGYTHSEVHIPLIVVYTDGSQLEIRIDNTAGAFDCLYQVNFTIRKDKRSLGRHKFIYSLNKDATAAVRHDGANFLTSVDGLVNRLLAADPPMRDEAGQEWIEEQASGMELESSLGLDHLPIGIAEVKNLEALLHSARLNVH